MQIGSNRLISTSVLCFATAIVAGCASMREHDVTMAQVSDPAAVEDEPGAAARRRRKPQLRLVK